MKKSPEKLIAYLEKFNKWRRGCAYHLQPHPKKVGDAIDQAVEMLKKNDVATNGDRTKGSRVSRRVGR